jgi:tRNA (adenine57-N1/adenine58-N1)-methyltransferase catalytic subunit
MYETLARPHDVSQIQALTPISEISEKLKQAERKREDKRQKQIAMNRSIFASKRKREQAAVGGAEQEPQADAKGGNELTGSKRTKIDHEDSTGCAPDQDTNTTKMTLDLPENVGIPPTGTAAPAATSSSSVSPELAPGSSSCAPKISVSRIFPEVRGHTSYLTFACLHPFNTEATVAVGSETAEVKESVEAP